MYKLILFNIATWGFILFYMVKISISINWSAQVYYTCNYHFYYFCFVYYDYFNCQKNPYILYLLKRDYMQPTCDEVEFTIKLKRVRWSWLFLDSYNLLKMKSSV